MCPLYRRMIYLRWKPFDRLSAPPLSSNVLIFYLFPASNLQRPKAQCLCPPCLPRCALWNSLVTAERIPLGPALFNSSKKTSAAYLTGVSRNYCTGVRLPAQPVRLNLCCTYFSGANLTGASIPKELIKSSRIAAYL
jgi:hypothetical protein